MTELRHRSPFSWVEVPMRPVRAAGFWAAVTLPPIYLAVFTLAPDMNNAAMLFAASVILNIVAAVVGHGYKRS